MAMRKTIFCELHFLEKYREVLPHYDNPLDEDERMEFISKFSRALFSSNLWLDCTNIQLQEKLSEDPESYLKYIVKRNAVSGLELNFAGESFPQLDKDDLSYNENYEVICSNAMFLTKDDYTLTAEAWGVLHINLSNIEKAKCFFKDSGIAIQKGETEKAWLRLNEKIKHSHNSLLIFDNYILDDDKAIKDNLIPILEMLLPQKLNIPFYLTIFSKIFDDNKLGILISKLKDLLKKLRPNLDIRLEIFPSHNKFHDRTVISNNMWIGCGGGFDLYKREYYSSKAEKSTTVTVLYPFIHAGLNEWIDDAYTDILEDANKCLKISGKNSDNYLLKLKHT